jgi:hypothetical protein
LDINIIKIIDNILDPIVSNLKQIEKKKINENDNTKEKRKIESNKQRIHDKIRTHNQIQEALIHEQIISQKIIIQDMRSQSNREKSVENLRKLHII